MLDKQIRGLVISIHALREESDYSWLDNMRQYPISIHALREESDGIPLRTVQNWCNFNPRSPRGERLQRICQA